MTTTRSTNWRQIVVEADPDWVRDSRIVEEYEFGAGENKRDFKADYTKRGAYAPEEES